MVEPESSSKDRWNAGAYDAAASFVPKLTSAIVAELDAQSNDHILDIGCGDGQVTAQIAKLASAGKVLGINSSQSFIDTAVKDFSAPNCTYLLHDARELQTCPDVISGQWDKCFSNAALHWILQDATVRPGFFSSVYRALKPGGKLVFEMGGFGSITEVHAAVVSALIHVGLSNSEAQGSSPWYFPSAEEMRKLLSDAGFTVQQCYLEYRPTKLTPKNEGGTGGLKGWIRLMCADFLQAAPQGTRDQVVKEVCDVLEPIITREDGTLWLGYVRLRAVAVKD
jgi:trans-aconitate methyltransferase